MFFNRIVGVELMWMMLLLWVLGVVVVTGTGVDPFDVLLFLFVFLILRRMGKNKA